MSAPTRNNNVFKRIEKKYQLSSEKYWAFVHALAPYMQMDAYGLHTIGNIYYDTEGYDLIRHSIEKPPYKEKLRLRSYGTPESDTMVFIELKKKWDSTVFKRRISMTLHEAEDYLNHGIHPNRDSQILREIDYFLDFYTPTPKLFLGYDRIACYGLGDPEVRITFDAHIRSRETHLKLSNGDFGTLLLGDDDVLMEIKIPDAMPLWLASLLSDFEIFPLSFSKYGNIYKEKITLNRGKTLCSQPL